MIMSSIAEAKTGSLIVVEIIAVQVFVVRIVNDLIDLSFFSQGIWLLGRSAKHIYSRRSRRYNLSSEMF